MEGKRARRSHHRASGQDALHRVSAWASAKQLTLRQLKVNGKRNEISAIGERLNLLDGQGCSLTMDAIGTQTAIAPPMVEQQADYSRALNGHQAQRLDDGQAWFGYAQQQGWQAIPHSYAESIHKVRGRVDIRRWGASDDPLAFDYIRHDPGGTGLRSLIRRQRERRLDHQPQPELAFYIASLPADAARLLPAIRDPWSIENTGHWSLDVGFGDDASRVRIGHAPQNFALWRRLALTLLNQDTSKASLNQKRVRAALEHDFVLQLLSQF
jgi:predicted transposase YbfD/YdcC